MAHHQKPGNFVFNRTEKSGTLIELEGDHRAVWGRQLLLRPRDLIGQISLKSILKRLGNDCHGGGNS